MASEDYDADMLLILGDIIAEIEITANSMRSAPNPEAMAMYSFGKLSLLVYEFNKTRNTIKAYEDVKLELGSISENEELLLL